MKKTKWFAVGEEIPDDSKFLELRIMEDHTENWVAGMPKKQPLLLYEISIKGKEPVRKLSFDWESQLKREIEDLRQIGRTHELSGNTRLSRFCYDSIGALQSIIDKSKGVDNPKNYYGSTTAVMP